MAHHICECGRPAAYSRIVAFGGRQHRVRRARLDHTLCRQCYEAQMNTIHALTLSPKPVEPALDPQQRQARTILENFADIERMGFDLSGLLGIAQSLKAVAIEE